MPHTQLGFTHRFFTAPTLLHTIPFTHKHCYTQRLLYTNKFTRIYKHIYTQTFLHTIFLHTNTCTHNPFTHKHFYTQSFLHTNALNADVFTHTQKLHTSTCTRRPFTRTNQTRRNPQVWTLKHHFVRKGCRRTNQACKKPQFKKNVLNKKHRIYCVGLMMSNVSKTTINHPYGLMVATHINGKFGDGEFHCFTRNRDIAWFNYDSLVVPRRSHP